jgi:hypothetical protein
MERADDRNALKRAAKRSRRAGRRSCRSNRERRLPWRRSIRRTRRAIDSSMRLLDSSRRVIEISEQSRVRRPLWTSRQLQRAAGWLCEASARLVRASLDLRNTVDEAERTPERATEAPHQLIDATARFLSNASEIVALFDRLEEASGQLLASATNGAVTFDLPGLDHDFRHKPAAPRLITGQLLLEIRLPEESGRIRLISIRRRRPRPIAFAETARRVFRGRAPPHAAICLL